MKKEDSLQFVQDRLRQKDQNRSPLQRELRLLPRSRVKRRFAVHLERGDSRRFDRVDRSLMVRCSEGSLWITHDGDPKDVILSPEESYRAEREDAMQMFALQPCLLEIEFEDEAPPLHPLH